MGPALSNALMSSTLLRFLLEFFSLLDGLQSVHCFADDNALSFFLQRRLEEVSEFLVVFHQERPDGWAS
jgi:hypothetical protein